MGIVTCWSKGEGYSRVVGGGRMRLRCAASQRRRVGFVDDDGCDAAVLATLWCVVLRVQKRGVLLEKVLRVVFGRRRGKRSVDVSYLPTCQEAELENCLSQTPDPVAISCSIHGCERKMFAGVGVLDWTL